MFLTQRLCQYLLDDIFITVHHAWKHVTVSISKLMSVAEKYLRCLDIFVTL